MSHNEFEKNVMIKLLSGEDEGLEQLRKQYNVATIVSREFTGYGFFTQFKVDDTLAYKNLKGRIDDVKGKIEDSPEVIYFILYVEDGKIDTLECFCILDKWKESYKDAKIEYCFGNRREYELK